MKNKYLLFILLFILAIPTFSSLLRPGIFPMHDDMQAMRLLQVDKCVKDNQIPCRWVPDMGYGYGYPQFNYYAPTPYYIMEGFHLLGVSFLDSVKMGFILSVLASAAGMYLLGSSLWGRLGGVVSSLLYVYAPYRAVNMYVRGAMGELWGIAFFPIILWASRKVLQGDKKSILWLALSLAGLFTSHNISSLIFIPIIIVWVIFQYKDLYHSPILKGGRELKNFSISIIWGFILSAFFIIPAWFEKDLVHVETLLSGYFNYLAHFVGISQMLFSSYWGYGTSQIGAFDEIFLGVGLIYWLLPLLVLLVLFLRKKKELKLTLFLVILGWGSLFFIHPRSVWFWNNIGIFAYLQFPWRLLSLATLFFSIAGGAIASLIPKRKSVRFYTVITTIAVLYIFYASFFQPEKWLNIDDQEQFSGKQWEQQQTISIYDFLPIDAIKPPSEKAPQQPFIIEGKVDIAKGKKGTNWQEWQVIVNSESARIQLPLYYFPNWQVRVDENIVEFNYDNELGLITFSVDKGEHKIVAKLIDTPIRSFSNIASMIGLISIPIYLKRKKFV